MTNLLVGVCGGFIVTFSIMMFIHVTGKNREEGD